MDSGQLTLKTVQKDEWNYFRTTGFSFKNLVSHFLFSNYGKNFRMIYTHIENI